MAPQVSGITSIPPPEFTPALKPPPGVNSSPDHPDTLIPLANITIGLCIPLVTIFVALRMYVRLFIKRVWILEDAIVATAWAGTIGYCAIMRTTMSHHGGEHGWDITHAEASQAAYWFHVSAVEYGFFIGMTKLAVLWLYRRVFSPVRWSPFDMAIVFLAGFTIAFYTSTTLVKIFECTPRERIWNKDIPGRCIQIKWILNVSGGFNTVSDWLILLLPVHAVLQLQMSRTKRVIVVLAFTFGLWYA